MSAETPSKSPSVDSDNPLDLKTVFKDSAGLRIARFIVGEYLKADRQRSAGNTAPSFAQDTFCSVSPLRFDSSPEFRRMLEERLVFSETEPLTSDPETLGTGGFSQKGSGGFKMSRESYLAPSARAERNHQQANLFAKAHSTAHISYPQQSAYHSSVGTFQTQVSLLSRPQFRTAKSQAELEIDALFDEPDSQTQGTESPYKVESPSGRASGVSSLQHSPVRRSDNDSLPAHLQSLEKDPLQLDQFFFSNSPPLNHTTQPSAPRHKYLSDSGYFSQAQAPSASIQQSQHGNHNTTNHAGVSPIETSSRVKSFLPVNKTTDNDTSSHIVKHPGFSHSLLSDGTAAGSQSGIASAHSPAPNNDNTAYHHNTTQSCPTHIHPHPHPPSSSSANTVHIDPERPLYINESQDIEMEQSTSDAASKKRKAKTAEGPRAKKLRTSKADKPKRIPKAKEQKPEPAKHRLGQDLWMRILEFTPPQFMKKARQLSKEFKGWVDNFNSIYVNQRKENYGQDMPDPPRGITERQYNDLLGGKGCMEPGCPDFKATRAHWSWCQRWCWDCWKLKIEREDRVLKLNQSPHGRNLISKLLECIPVGMHDSFLKPHDFVEDLESRPRGAPRLYRYYLKEDVREIIAKYDALTPPPYKEDPTQTPEARAAAQAAYQAEMEGLDEKKANFLAKGKEKNDEFMKSVQKIESLVKKKRDKEAQPYNKNRQARRELFTRRARDDLPHIPTSFVHTTKAYKAATRIFRDGGTERGWQTLKPKIEKEFEKSKGTGNASIEIDIDIEEDDASDRDDDNNDTHNTTQMEMNRADLQNHVPLTVQEFRQQQHRQRQFNAQQMLAQRELMLGSSAISSSSLPSGMGFGNLTMMQAHQHPFGGPAVRATSLYDSFGDTLFQRQHLRNRSGALSNFNSYPSFASMSQSSTHPNSNNYQPSSQQPPRIPISSLLGPTPPPPKAPHYDPFA